MTSEPRPIAMHEVDEAAAQQEQARREVVAPQAVHVRGPDVEDAERAPVALLGRREVLVVEPGGGSRISMASSTPVDSGCGRVAAKGKNRTIDGLRADARCRCAGGRCLLSEKCIHECIQTGAAAPAGSRDRLAAARDAGCGSGPAAAAAAGRPCRRADARPRRAQPSRSSSVRATTLVARRRSSSTRCSSARLALLSSTVRGPAP